MKKFQLLFSKCGIGNSEISKSKIENIKFNILIYICGIDGCEN